MRRHMCGKQFYLKSNFTCSILSSLALLIDVFPRPFTSMFNTFMLHVPFPLLVGTENISGLGYCSNVLCISLYINLY